MNDGAVTPRGGFGYLAGTDIAFDEIPIESEFEATRTDFGNKGLWTQQSGTFILRKLKDITPMAGQEYIFQVVARSIKEARRGLPA